MELVILPWIREKIENVHRVAELEVEEAFFAFEGVLLIDDRADHRTQPPTVWFLSETFEGRRLKLVCLWDKDNQRAVLKTAYDPSIDEVALYDAHS